MVRRLPPSWPCGHYRRDEITGKLRGRYAAINSGARLRPRKGLAVLHRRAFGLRANRSLNVEVQVELPRVRPQPYGVYLHLTLELLPDVDHVRGEDAALEQEVVVLLQRAQRLLQGAGNRLQLRRLFRRKLVRVLVQRIARVDLVLDAVQAGHEHGGKGQVRVAGRVRRAELDALGLRLRGVDGDACRGGAVAGGVHQVHRRLIAGDQPLVGVGSGRAERHQRPGVLQEAADVPAAELAGEGVALLVSEESLLVFPERLVDVHAGGGVAEQRLGHERGDLVVLAGDILDDVLVPHYFVG